MAGRGRLLPAFDDPRGRTFLPPGPLRGYGPSLPQQPPPLDLPRPLFSAMEQKLVVREAEVQRLIVENQKMAESHVLLRQQLASEQQESKRLQEDLAKIHAEKAEQMRGWAERVARMEAEVRALEPLKMELKNTQADVQKFLAQRRELDAQACQVQDEIVRTRSDLQKVPAFKAEIEAMKQELIRARTAYEVEKKTQEELVEQRQSVDKNMIEMAREIERLQAELSNVEKKIRGESGYPSAGVNPYRESYGLGQAWAAAGDNVVSTTYGGAGAAAWRGGGYDMLQGSGSYAPRR